MRDGTATLGITHRKRQFLVPVLLLLRALSGYTDREIYEAIVRGDEHNSFLVERVELLLSTFQTDDVFSRKKCLAFLGSKFRVALNLDESQSDMEAAKILLRRTIFIHLSGSDHKVRSF
jgi:DNA-directed RNA polymerase I subunit RPA2